VENRGAPAANFTCFNVLLLFAQFQCSWFFIGAIFLRDEGCAQCKALKISLPQVEEEDNRGVAMLSVRILQFETI
jgi:hypothetical protein